MSQSVDTTAQHVSRELLMATAVRLCVTEKRGN